MIKAVIFDLDGTLADTIEAIREGLNLTMREFGFPEHTYDEVRSYVNNGARELCRRAMPAGLQSDENKVDEVKALYDKMYEKTYFLTDRTYGGVVEALTTLKENGYRIAVLSNKQDEFVKKLCTELLPEGICDTCYGQSAKYPKKPDPTVPHLIAKELGVLPSECAFVGDSDVDIMTAKNAGMTSIGVSWGYRPAALLASLGADLIVNTPDGIVKFLVK